MRRVPFLGIPHRHLPYRTPSATLSFPFLYRWTPMASTTAAARRSKKIVVIMGPTGCGKSKLSIDLASRFFRASEIINSDKIQIYRGLDITTNKITFPERRSVPHSLLGEFDPSESHPEFTPSDFRSAAAAAISRIHARRNIPFVVGGSNSFVYALLAKTFDAAVDVFGDGEAAEAFCKELRYNCCFIWVDASPAVLNQYLVKRVDAMVDLGMVEELSEYLASDESDSVSQCGLRKAIGVAEFGRYFQKLRNGPADDVARRAAYDSEVRAIKDNTCQLAKRQLGKIRRLRDAAGWDLKRVDATAALRAAMGGAARRRTAEIWEKQVLEPSVKIVKQFLME
ncbi:adenylate isopentenyltransferase-like [Andrographis paniculata]|uniref:adenylate isopentenyltransferase-like n=1 Tax=Andrographis paniculata TaxID=175694 RepID=UPI0021E89DC7|nr:adenylate isopentenyltransferase-like [Andrographis paniculata]